MGRFLIALFISPILTLSGIDTQLGGRVARASIEASVQEGAQGFIYVYRATNSIESTAAIWKLSVDLSSPAGGRDFAWDGLVLDPLSELVRDRPDSTHIVPASVISPVNWTGGLAVNGNAIWAADDEAGIPPGSVAKGFQLVSPGPPMIRAFTAEPFISVDQVPVSPPSDEFTDVQRFKREVLQFRSNAGSPGWTLGPGSLPAIVTPRVCFDVLRGNLDRAISLGWVQNVSWALSLSVKIDSACGLLSKDENASVRVLRALVQEIQAQSGKHLSSQAAALLLLNAQYLSRKF